MKKLNIVWAASEVRPFAKTGGLADVSASLTDALAERGHNVTVIMPFYRQQVEQQGLEFTASFDLLKIPFGYNTEWAKLLEYRVSDNLAYYFIEFDRFFNRESLYSHNGYEYSDNGQRYIFFSRAVMEAVKLLKIKTDIIHANDWHSALCCVYLRSDLYRNNRYFKQAKSVLTIHNIGYQGRIDKSNMYWTNIGWDYFNFDCLEFFDAINLLKGGIMTADMVNAVSAKYAEEILDRELSFGLDGPLNHRKEQNALRGIVNGIDQEIWNPAADPLIHHKYSLDSMHGKELCKRDLQREFKLPVDPSIPLIGSVSRLAYQKGLDVFAACLEELLATDNIQFVILGDGDAGLEGFLQYLQQKYPDKLGVYIGYSDKLSHMIEAGSDLFIMPSRYEPCGLNQLYSMRYGTLPIVRATGGLDETVVNYDMENPVNSTGFKFYDLTPAAIKDTIRWAVSTYLHRQDDFKLMQQNGMKQDFSWNHTAALYELLYQDANRTI